MTEIKTRGAETVGGATREAGGTPSVTKPTPMDCTSKVPTNHLVRESLGMRGMARTTL